MDSYLEDEFAPHFTAWKAEPHPANAGKLLGAVQPVLDSALRTYVGTNASPTLRSKAKVMALDAMQSYDPSRAKLRTHLMSQLQGLRRASAKEAQILSVPEQIALDQQHVREAEGQLRDTLGRDPSDYELSEHVMLSPARLAHLRKARNVLPEGFIQSRTTGEGDDLYDPAVQSRGAPNAWHQFVHSDLGPIDQKIMEHTLGMNNKPVLQNQEIARRLGLSPGAISQRKARIQNMLNMRDELGVL